MPQCDDKTSESAQLHGKAEEYDVMAPKRTVYRGFTEAFWVFNFFCHSPWKFQGKVFYAKIQRLAWLQRICFAKLEIYLMCPQNSGYVWNSLSHAAAAEILKN